ncbi:hypothetical protein, partial [Paenibacillus zanthoxyli]|uniref:hypothetical protein n=1 Tax=Paenibacillus zanthoxyli TaxID=369399 RepID=UPI0012EC6A33
MFAEGTIGCWQVISSIVVQKRDRGSRPHWQRQAAQAALWPHGQYWPHRPRRLHRPHGPYWQRQ